MENTASDPEALENLHMVNMTFILIPEGNYSGRKFIGMNPSQLNEITYRFLTPGKNRNQN
jgi:hypothetical protein